jgi:hypothetical protein
MGDNNSNVTYPINGVDLTSHLPIPLQFGWGEAEKKALSEFRELTVDWAQPTDSDWYLSRFLVARRWDVTRATELFITAMKWRKEEVSPADGRSHLTCRT